MNWKQAGFMYKLTFSEPQHRGNQLKSTRPLKLAWLTFKVTPTWPTVSKWLLFQHTFREALVHTQFYLKPHLARVAASRIPLEKPWSKLGSSSKPPLTKTVGFDVAWEKPWTTSSSNPSPLSQNCSHVSQKDLQPTLALAPILWSNNFAHSVCIGMLPHKEWER